MARLLLSMIIVLSCPVSAEVLAGETGKDVEKDGAESQEKGKSVESPKGSPSKGEEKLPEVQLEDMVLTATRSMQSREDVPGSVVVVPFRELMAKHFHGTDEALKDSLGIYNRRTKGMMDIMPSLSLRGIDLKRCLVLVDGHRRKDWLTIPPQTIDRIEAVKGPFSALYGDRAFGGVVNIITKTPKKRLISISAGLEERGTWMSGAMVGDSFEGFSFLIGGRARQTDGWITNFYTVREYTGATPAGAVVTGWKETRDKKGNTRYMVGDMGRNWYKDENLFASLGFEEPDLFDAKFHLYYKDGEYGYSGGKTWLWENGSLVDDGVVEIDDDGVTRKLQISSSKFQSTYGGDLSWGLGLTCVLKIGKQVQIAARIGGSLGDYWYADPSSTSSSTGTRDVWGGLESVFDLKNLDVLGSHKITFGMDFRDEETDCEKWNLNDWKDVDSRTQLSYDMSGRIDIWGIYLQDEWTPFDPLTLYVGCRYDYWMNGDGRSRVWNSGIGGYVADSYGSDSEGVFSYKIAAVFKPLKMTTLRGSFGTSFRGPDATELYKTWAYGSSIYPGNPQLKPERNLAWEIGLTQRIGSIGEFLKKSSITAVVFDNHLDDYIYRKTLDAAGVADYNAEHGTAYSNVKTYDNVARARIYGLELGAKAEFPLGISVFVNWTHLNARVVENDANPASEGKMLPYVPRNVCSVGIAFKQTVEDRHAFSARLAGRFVERVFTTDDNSDCKQHVFGAYEDFFVVDLKISYSFDDQYRFSFWVDNLFDELYFQYYKAPGRSIGCSVDVKF